MINPSYRTPRGWNGGPMKYGASLGRPNTKIDPDYDGRLYVHRVPIDSGGYDPGGAYWGAGASLYWYGSADGEVDGYIRADSRRQAAAMVREEMPDAKIYGRD